MPTETAQPAVDKDLQNRVNLFDRELTALQQKYNLRIIAQVAYPDGAVLSVPIRLVPTAPIAPAIAPADEASKPE